jgi:hypothetical protein
MKIKSGVDKEHAVREEPSEFTDGAIMLYRNPDGSMNIDVRPGKETLWMDVHQMARLFGRDRSVIVRHIRNIYDGIYNGPVARLGMLSIRCREMVSSG